MTRDARLSALHRGGFLGLGAALPSPSAPAVLQRRAVAFRIRAASSSQPGHSAWRAGSRASRGQRLQAGQPQDATPRSAFRMSPETPLDEQGWESYILASVRSQAINAICSRTLQGLASQSITEHPDAEVAQPMV